MGPNQVKAMRYLQANPDGATLKQVREHLRTKTRDAGKAIAGIPHKYRDRWTLEDGKLVEVWCLADVPPDAPHPHSKEEP